MKDVEIDESLAKKVLGFLLKKKGYRGIVAAYAEHDKLGNKKFYMRVIHKDHWHTVIGWHGWENVITAGCSKIEMLDAILETCKKDNVYASDLTKLLSKGTTLEQILVEMDMSI